MTKRLNGKAWICNNSNFCNGSVENASERIKCWNCGISRYDKRRTK